MTKRRRRHHLDGMIECVEDSHAPHGVSIYVVVDGVRIARRGDPDTPQARTWVSLEPGWAVRDVGPDKIEVEYSEAPVQ